MNTTTNTNTLSYKAGTPTKATYAYPFRSLNGAVCYKEVINSMMKFLSYQNDETNTNETMNMVTNKAESWTSMRITHLNQSKVHSADLRVFDMDQIMELNNAETYDDMWSSLLKFKDSQRLAYFGE
jgi:hypothetical protein